MPMSVVRRRAVVLVLAGAVLAAGCHGPGAASLTATAEDEWQRSYTLAPGGTLEIENRNGFIEIEGGDGAAVEVTAHRIARSMTEDAARELLPRIEISEEVSPDRVSIETEGIEGMLIGAAYEVRYRVKTPRETNLRVRLANGDLTVRDVAGSAALNGTNGTLTAEGLRGGLEARTVNGKVSISLAEVGDDLVDVRTTNGEIELSLPAKANATVMATVTNGRIDVSGVPLEQVGEQSRRRVRGRLNGGGTPVEIATVNGSIRVTTHP